MRYIVQEEGVIDGRVLPRYVIARELTKLACGARTEHEVEERIRARFLPKPQVWVKLRMGTSWSILVQFSPGRESESFYIPKK